MDQMKKAIFILILVLTVFGMKLDCIAVNIHLQEDTCEILLIGNSHFAFNNFPDILFKLASSGLKNVLIDQYTPGGWHLDKHSDDSITELKINERDWDFVILYGTGRVTAYPLFFSEQALEKSIQILKQKIALNSSSSTMIFCLPWADEDGMTWIDGWTDQYDEMQVKIYENTLSYSDKIGFPIAPVGWAWYKVLVEKGHPLHYLHTSDWNHPSLRGSYLMACVIYASVFRESAEGIPYYSELSPEECAYFQSLASTTVLDSLELWNNTGEAQMSRIDAKSTSPILSQNYPNPFFYGTSIEYETENAGFIKLSIFDQQGRKIFQLVNEFHLPGRYSVEFNANSLPEGLYYYSIRDRNNIITRKMVLKR